MANNSVQLPLGVAERYPGLYTLIEVISQIFTELVIHGERKPPIYNSQTAKFFGSQPCPYPINSYLKRIAQYSGCSNECFVLLFIYVDRLVCSHKFGLTSSNVHRLIITGIMAAAKFFDDQFYFNSFFANVGGVKTWEINILEVEFLFLLEFDMYVSREDYERYYNYLSGQAISRGTVFDRNLLPYQLAPPMEIISDSSVEYEDEECSPYFMEAQARNDVILRS